MPTRSDKKSEGEEKGLAVHRGTSEVLQKKKHPEA